jgi:diacylglycerol kinase (ATP)
VGGDGTLNEVINGVMNVSTAVVNLETQIHVAVLPKGTGNDFARTMNMPDDLLVLKHCIDKDIFKMVDLGLAYYTDTNKGPVSRYFINITDVGMGGIIAEKTTRYSKWMGAYLTFQRAIISTLISYKKQVMYITADKKKMVGEMLNVVVANGKYFGSGLGIAPEASAHDGRFSIVTIGDISLFHYLILLGQLKNCQVLPHPEVKYMQAEQVMLDAPSHALPIDMDGEFVGYTPLKICIVPKALKFRYPG